MVEHGGISRAHVGDMLRSKDIRVRSAAFTLLEASNPRLRQDSALFMEIVQFIWNANPSYNVYQEFSKRHLFVQRYKVHELIIARLKREKRAEESATPVQHVEHGRRSAPGFFKRLFGRSARRRERQSVAGF
jgi:spore coat protein CotF